ncbi:MAG: hypothetical protein HC768_23795 [Acaryochloris sp. CRU_2_0]|nr:hypothetical protein [Acaryochloris sp. CRU_2_0]
MSISLEDKETTNGFVPLYLRLTETMEQIEEMVRSCLGGLGVRILSIPTIHRAASTESNRQDR